MTGQATGHSRSNGIDFATLEAIPRGLVLLVPTINIYNIISKL